MNTNIRGRCSSRLVKICTYTHTPHVARGVMLGTPTHADAVRATCGLFLFVLSSSSLKEKGQICNGQSTLQL